MVLRGRELSKCLAKITAGRELYWSLNAAKAWPTLDQDLNQLVNQHTLLRARIESIIAVLESSSQRITRRELATSLRSALDPPDPDIPF